MTKKEKIFFHHPRRQVLLSKLQSRTYLLKLKFWKIEAYICVCEWFKNLLFQAYF